ncbi:histidine--tRNA ligase [Eisenibacter elegans]|uniref:histidine--tRNA ligase n=1 Tax=Eisenibacter elegans TaxID=997 RepID=UPI0004003782|nr:histidine--tRNA ligase [Eisenibacter elegans]
MSKQKPALPKGTRDFGPEVMVKRNYILDTIKRTFQKFGFLPLETPSIERFDVLTGKYGEEGDRLIFRAFNAGSLRNYSPEDYRQKGEQVIQEMADSALRYDLTVPFARYVVMNRGTLTFPFKRYQIQPVWRGDRPQRGRYREFYQCDADVVGTDSLLCETEIVLMVNEVLQNLGIQDFTLKINNRKILTGIAEAIGAPSREADLCVAIDKLDKIGQAKVNEELQERGFDAMAITALQPLFDLNGSNTEILAQLETLLANSAIGLQGVAELKQMLAYLQDFTQNPQADSALNTQLDVMLARGLSYYTGAIFEVKVNNVAIGSISGGGRYDNLTGTFGLEGVSGVGFSFGVDRIFDVMEELQLFPETVQQATQVLFTNFDEDTMRYSLPLLQALRNEGIRAEMYPEASKLKKQLNYANAKQIPFVILIGEEERQQQRLGLKNMQTGEQQNYTLDEVVTIVKQA